MHLEFKIDVLSKYFSKMQYMLAQNIPFYYLILDKLYCKEMTYLLIILFCMNYFILLLLFYLIS